ncbi:MAG TPA: MxaK protein [Burkholderiaceae bacterium]|nr:MxaK protein [Burkholderiaceae bacterium]
MGLITRTRVRVVWALLAGLAAAAAVDGMRLVRAQRWNAQIDAGVTTLAAAAPPQVRLAMAAAQAASGAQDAALRQYGTLQDDPAVGQAARYNSANLLMRQAIALREQSLSGQALALVELAKEHYREVLRRDPDHWNARYNLERAQRLVPDPEELEPEPAGPQRAAERAATTMRGYSPGLP